MILLLFATQKQIRTEIMNKQFLSNNRVIELQLQFLQNDLTLISNSKTDKNGNYKQTVLQEQWSDRNSTLAE